MRRMPWWYVAVMGMCVGMLVAHIMWLVGTAHAAEGQKRIDGVISGDQRPIGAYQGPSGTHLRRVVDICNLGNAMQTWPITITVDPPIATATYVPGITVPARECLKYYFTLTILDGEPAKQEAWAVVQIGSQLGPLRRYVTRCPPTRRTCGARR